jgi:hypothetical protein
MLWSVFQSANFGSSLPPLSKQTAWLIVSSMISSLCGILLVEVYWNIIELKTVRWISNQCERGKNKFLKIVHADSLQKALKSLKQKQFIAELITPRS